MRRRRRRPSDPMPAVSPPRFDKPAPPVMPAVDVSMSVGRVP